MLPKVLVLCSLLAHATCLPLEGAPDHNWRFPTVYPQAEVVPRAADHLRAQGYWIADREDDHLEGWRRRAAGDDDVLRLWVQGPDSGGLQLRVPRRTA